MSIKNLAQINQDDSLILSTLVTAPKQSPDDLKAELMAKIGDISAYRTLHPTKVLVAVLVREKIGSLYTADKTQAEDVYQGKSFLVLKMGAAAYADSLENGITYFGYAPQVGDWVEARPCDGEHIKINGVDCRIFTDRDIRGVLDDPTIVW